MQQIKLDFHKVVFSKFQCALIDSRKLNNKCLKTEKGKNFHVLNSISVFKKRKTEVQWFDLFFICCLEFLNQLYLLFRDYGESELFLQNKLLAFTYMYLSEYICSDGWLKPSDHVFL